MTWLSSGSSFFQYLLLMAAASHSISSRGIPKEPYNSLMVSSNLRVSAISKIQQGPQHDWSLASLPDAPLARCLLFPQICLDTKYTSALLMICWPVRTIRIPELAKNDYNAILLSSAGFTSYSPRPLDCISKTHQFKNKIPPMDGSASYLLRSPHIIFATRSYPKTMWLLSMDSLGCVKAPTA
jgi:hypothetical protein